MSWIYHLVVLCVLLEESIVLSSCVVNDTDPIDCNEYPTGSLPYVYCDIFSPVNATTVRDVLTSCTVGEPYRSITLVYHGQGEIELQLYLGDNVTELSIWAMFGQELCINPLKQHTNITHLHIVDAKWEIRDLVLSEYFPNLEALRVFYEHSITTIDNNLLSNLSSLYDLTWRSSSLVNISDDSFKGLSSLSRIDLSDNSISYLSSETFEYLPSLDLLSVYGRQLNCTCQLQWMSVVDTNGWVRVYGECDGSGLRVDSPSTYSQCHNTESYQCFNKSISCENVCINTPSSYVCACDAGYGLTLLEAEEACHDIDECVQNVAICQGQSCRNTLGSYECYCSAGFVSGAGGDTCVDVDECSSSPCEHNCMNTMGSYWCSCLENFVLEEEGHICECESGYNITADRSECVDVDECVYENGGCDSICVNTAGGYTCTLSVADNSVSVTFMVTSVLLAIALITVTLVWMITCVCCICYRNKLRSQPENDSQPEVSKDKNYTIFGSDERDQHMYADPDYMKRDVSPSAYPGYDSHYTPMHSRKPEVPPHYLNVETN